MKIIVYSANINNYDYFYHPSIIDPKVDYMLFTDNIYFKSNIWNIINSKTLNINHLTNRKIARCIKINPHIFLPPHDISIWIDHCYQVRIDDVLNCLKTINFDHSSNIMLYNHISRNCIYKEAETCIASKLDDPTVIKNQMIKYEKENFPKNFGLFETGFMIRKNNLITNKLNDLWWEEVLNNSGRDQLSQCYASWKLGIKINSINVGNSQWNNPFIWGNNKHKK